MIKTIDAKGVYYRQLNDMVQQAVNEGAAKIVLKNVNGQRYIATRVSRPVDIEIKGVPGNDLGAYMNGSTVIVRDNGQDAIGNTMNAGKIVVHGHAGDVLGYAMRGGKLFIKGDVGYRVGIHMKEYEEQVPVLIIGGTAGSFLGEYMAGGVLIILGLDRKPGEPIAGDYLGTGMHGGVIFVRGEVDKTRLGKEVSVFELNEADNEKLDQHLREYCNDLGIDYDEVRKEKFVKLVPVSHRPYGNLYVHT
ncbi:MAG: GltB/FmdC/FwdC-like GXGXG domain-containing protein [Eubacteriales bacterium]